MGASRCTSRCACASIPPRSTSTTSTAVSCSTCCASSPARKRPDAHGPHRNPMRLVLFDLDGTITYRDTLLPYVTGFLARTGRSRWRMARVLPTLAAFAVGAADHGAVKSGFIRATLGGATRARLSAWTDEFVPAVVARGCSPG